MRGGASQDRPPLDYLGPIVSTTAYLRERPGNEHALRRRDETVRRAARVHHVSLVAKAAGLSPRAVAEIVVGTEAFAGSRKPSFPVPRRPSQTFRFGYVPRRG
jgi:hypothetical protein